MIVTPSDWLEVAQLNRNLGKTISSSLRKPMKMKFEKFDEYQLQKHNKNRKRPKKTKKDDSALDLDAVHSAGDSDNEDDVEPEKLFKGPEKLTIKNLIRTLHINYPGYYVMAILGKTYPKTIEEFYASRIDGEFKEELAGKRMKLETAYTWETELSKHGNTATAWEGLIMSRKLPYMAALRNLRNLFLANMNEEAQGKILYYLSNRNAVESSKQMPFQFYNAFNALSELGNTLEEFHAAQENKMYEKMKFKNGIKAVLKANHRGQYLVPKANITEHTLEAYDTLLRGGDVSKARIERNFHTRNKSWKKKYPEWEIILSEAKKIRYEYKRVYDQKWGKLVSFFSHKQIHWNKEIVTKRLEKYKKTVNDAMVLSLHNLPPVPGMTVIMIKYVMRRPQDDEKRLSMIKTKNNQALILAACAISCCQDTILFVTRSKYGPRTQCEELDMVKLEFNPRKNLLENVENWRSKIEEIRQGLTF